MLRGIKIQGPASDIDAVVEVGQEGILDFEDYFLDQDVSYSALLTSFDDEEFRADEVFAQVQTLLGRAGADFSRFYVSENYTYWPDAMPTEWYKNMHRDYVGPLHQLEQLGVRTPEQQVIMDWARREIKSRVAAACEVAEFNISEFTARVTDLLGGIE